MMKIKGLQINHYIKCIFILTIGLNCYSLMAQTNGYIYVHKKALSEQNSIDFPFTVTGGLTSVPSFSLNDIPAQNTVLDLGASQDGTLWATGENNGYLFYRDPNSSQWLAANNSAGSAPINNAQRVDGAIGGSCFWVSTGGAAYYYNGTTHTSISPSTSITDIGSAWDGGVYFINAGDLYYKAVPTSGAASARLTTTGDYIRVDGDPSTHDAIVRRNNNNVYRITKAGVITLLGRPTASVIDRDIAVTEDGSIFGSTAVFVYKWISGTTWGPAEATSRKYASRMTGGPGGVVWGTTNEPNVGDLSKNIYTRIERPEEILWLNDERVRVSTKGNSIMIPVAPGSYILEELVPAGWDLVGIDIYDPSGNSISDLPNNKATINVAAGETVGVIFENIFLRTFSILKSCNSEYLEDFGTGGGYGPALSGQTSYHSQAGGQSFSNNYMILQNASMLFPGAAAIGDHTPNDVDGRMMVVDANNEKDAFFRRRFANVEPGSTYEFSAWIANINTGAQIKPNVTFEVIDPITYQVLRTYTTGEITSGAWVKYGLTSFIAPSSSFDLVIRNNGFGGSGNDLALDDIRFKLLPPSDPFTTVSHSDCNQSRGSITVTSPIAAGFEYSISSAPTTWQTSPVFNNLLPGIYTISTRYIGSVNCVVSTVDTVQVSICGKLFMDGNGMNDGFVNGNLYNGSEPMYAVLYNNTTNKVDSIVPLTNGEYKHYGHIDTNYTVYLTANNAAVIGQSAIPNMTLPANYVRTGELIGTAAGSDGPSNSILIVGTVNQSVDNVNFGIQQRPQSHSKSHELEDQPTNNAIIPLNGVGSNAPLMTGSDAEDGDYSSNTGTITNPIGVKITSLPTNGELWYNGVRVTTSNLNSTIFPNPALFSIVLSDGGYRTTSFQYSYVDAAGFEDLTPATYTIGWSVPLSVHLLSFKGDVKKSTVELLWITGSETNNKGFEIQRSTNTTNWETLGFVASKAVNGSSVGNLSYSFTDFSPQVEDAFYRLKQIDLNGIFEYSAIRLVNYVNNAAVKLFPNPAKNQATISGLEIGSDISIIDGFGKTVLKSVRVTNTTVSVNTSALLKGIYLVMIMNKEGKILTGKLIKE
ncbi:T9SS type A sorting domain-containing protein [Polluticaenibacter yanchengensis]|uniref:T9SS type A sorting domain-containing protein n=1 Tax=Polluticaenibacter yanchengensis TaxID=3014562 RepID=A0ABT4UFF5_9BACT|nr:T9SS type A sorting domain-containing protein [Chitinophagaceae bacterium LY-5]